MTPQQERIASKISWVLDGPEHGVYTLTQQLDDLEALEEYATLNPDHQHLIELVRQFAHVDYNMKAPQFQVVAAEAQRLGLKISKPYWIRE